MLKSLMQKLVAYLCFFDHIQPIRILCHAYSCQGQETRNYFFFWSKSFPYLSSISRLESQPRERTCMPLSTTLQYFSSRLTLQCWSLLLYSPWQCNFAFSFSSSSVYSDSTSNGKQRPLWLVLSTLLPLRWKQSDYLNQEPYNILKTGTFQRDKIKKYISLSHFEPNFT